MAKTLTLKYDFEPYKCCEIKIDGSWFRVTARQFRSFDGERRISTSIDENNQLIYRDYNWSLYKITLCHQKNDKLYELYYSILFLDNYLVESTIHI